jgi:DeoR/GlpR family transcriptional regulator of sugar metabolism
MPNGNTRTDFILQALQQHGRVDAEDLSRQLAVNSSTIRRDLEKLERQHLLRRIHGGAVPIDTLSYSTYGQDLTFQINMSKQPAEKARIAQAAINLILPGDTIALSPGTTTTYLARQIRQSQLQNLHVVTNALNIAMELANLPGITLTLIGGILLPDFFALVGPTAEQALKEMYVARAFLGVTGLHSLHGLTGPNQLEAFTHRMMLEHARQTIVLADHTKLDHLALYAIAPITAIQMVITDRDASPTILSQLRNQDIDVQSV